MVKIFYSDITDADVNDNIVSTLPELRKHYVDSITNIDRKVQSVYVWKLLEYALKNNGINNYNFGNNSNGEWYLVDNEYYFSLTHSENIVAVAVSDKKVGIDVELCSNKILGVAKKFPECPPDILSLTTAWVTKECQYKSKLNVGVEITTIKDVLNNNYVLGVCNGETSNLNITKINKEILYNE